MINYKFVAYNHLNKRVVGTIIAADKIEALSLLRQKQLNPIKLHKTTFYNKKISISENQLLVLTKQLSALLSAGTSVEQSLQILKNESTNKKLAQLTNLIIEHIKNGNTLSSAFAKFPHIFDQIYISSIQAGENSASLDKVFDELSDYIEKQQLAKSKLQSALVYPILLLVVSLVVIYALVSVVLPQVVEQFISTNIELPLITKLLLSLSDIFPVLFSSLILLSGTSYFVYSSKLLTNNFKTILSKKFLQIPIFGNLILFSQTSRFCSSMHLMIKAGLNTVDSLVIAQNSFTNQYLRSEIGFILNKVQKGQSLSRSFSESKIFPSVFKQLLSSGDIGSQVSKMFFNIREYLEQEVETKKNIILTLLQPLVILFMGGFVMLIVLSIMLPLLQMNNLIFSI